MSDAERIAVATERYLAAMHAVQSGVAFEMNSGSPDTTPKHLRVGVNSALLNASALAALLIRKGVITEVEYYEVQAEFAEREQAAYEQRSGVSFA